MDTGGDPIIVFPHTNTDASVVLDLERQLIQSIGRIDLSTGPLTNLTNGGDGMLGKRQSDSQKNAISIALRGKPKSARHIESMKTGNVTKRKLWDITDPSGNKYVVTTLANFCDDHGLVYREMLKVAQHHAGNTKFNRAALHRGWKCEYHN